MTTIHLVYPHGPSISCPDAIGRKLGAELSRSYDVVHHDWDEGGVIIPGEDDVLLGHPHPAPWTVFRRSLVRRGWKKTIAMFPYTHGDMRHVAWAEKIIRRCDAFLAITGNYWFSTIGESPFAHWLPKMTHLDLAVDRSDYPALKRRFNPPGSRKFLYIGHNYWFKNMDYLMDIARSAPDVGAAWIGWSRRAIPDLEVLGRQDFRTASAKALVSQYDFMITVGSSDPNPTTILEAMAWGLVPVCTRESGYVGYPGIVNVPLGDTARAVECLRGLQALSEARLLEMRQTNWEALDRHFNWHRFTDQVVGTIETPSGPPIDSLPIGRRLRMRRAALTSPHFWMRPRQLWRAVRPLFARR